MGEHCWTLENMKVMTHLLPDKMFLALGAGFIDGVPNWLYWDVPYKEIKANISTGNLLAPISKPVLITKAIKVEERNHLSLCFDNLVMRFTSSWGVIKPGIIENGEKRAKSIDTVVVLPNQSTNYAMSNKQSQWSNMAQSVKYSANSFGA